LITPDQLLKRKEGIFVNEEVLDPKFIPDPLLHRDEQISLLQWHLAGIIKGELPPHLLLWGVNGTGKTAVTRWILERWLPTGSSGVVVDEKEGLYSIPERDVKIVYVPCWECLTEIRTLVYLINVLIDPEYPALGRPLEDVRGTFEKGLSGKVLVILDEFDEIYPRDRGRILNRLCRAGLSVIAISNWESVVEQLDAKTLSVFKYNKVRFPAYNAGQLRDILYQRARMAFVPGVVVDEAIGLIAAWVAQEEGDARSALDLLRSAGNIAARHGKNKVTATEAQIAQDERARKDIKGIVNEMPAQPKLILTAVAILTKMGLPRFTTIETYATYKTLCTMAGYTTITPQRMNQLIRRYSLLGVFGGGERESGGFKKGVMKRVSLQADLQLTWEALKTDAMVGDLILHDENAALNTVAEAIGKKIH